MSMTSSLKMSAVVQLCQLSCSTQNLVTWHRTSKQHQAWPDAQVEEQYTDSSHSNTGKRSDLMLLYHKRTLLDFRLTSELLASLNFCLGLDKLFVYASSSQLAVRRCHVVRHRRMMTNRWSRHNLHTLLLTATLPFAYSTKASGMFPPPLAALSDVSASSTHALRP